MRDIEPTALFYNPNIHPLEEFKHRKETMKQYAENWGVLPVIYDDEFDQDAFMEKFKDASKDQRCEYCYRRRLERTAQIAKEKGFDAFTSTLMISPYQNQEMIKRLGEEAAKKYKIEFLYEDFRSGYREGRRQALGMGLYCQKYCGCEFSRKEL
jgi:predicted adenine nucleotide alpha hydrolase (AANH) superfamily ATPase